MPELSPQHRDALKRLAAQEVQAGRWIDASKAYLQLLNFHPADADALLAAANCFHKMGDTACSRMMLNRLLELQPTHEAAKTHLRKLKLALNQDAGLVPDAGPLLSAIVVASGCEAWVKCCLEDLERQTVADLTEILVVRSEPQEISESFLEEYRRRGRHFVCLPPEPNENCVSAMNRGLKLAQGTYIVCPKIENRLVPEMLERMAYALSHDPQIGLVYGDHETSRVTGAALPGEAADARTCWPEFDRDGLLCVSDVSAMCVWRKRLHEDFGYFDAELAFKAALDFWLRISGATHLRRLPGCFGVVSAFSEDSQPAAAGRARREIEMLRQRHRGRERDPRPPTECMVTFPEPKCSCLIESALVRRPMVSVVIPTFNRPESLRETLRSVLSQTFQDFEILVVNDAGADVAALVASLDRGSQIQYRQHDLNRGESAARNTAVLQARGKYVAYLDDDDIFLPHHLQTLVEHLENTGAKIAYTDAYRARRAQRHGQLEGVERDLPYSQDFDRDWILVDNFVPINCLMHERACLASTGGFDEALPILADWDLWIRLSQRYQPAHIKKITCEFRPREETPEQVIPNAERFLAATEFIYAKHRALVADKPLLRAWQQKNLHDARQRLASLKSAGLTVSGGR